MKKSRLILALVLLTVLSNFSNAQSSDFIIYSAEKKAESGQVYEIFDHNGKPIFNEPVNWAYTIRWNWIIVKNKATKYLDIFDYQGQKLELKNVQEIREPFRDVNRIGIKINGKWGFYDKKGRLKIDHTYDEISAFYNNMAAAEVNGQIIMIDTNGIQINTPYDSGNTRYFMGESFDLLTMDEFHGNTNYKLTIENGKKGIVDKNSTVVVPAEYDAIVDFLEKQRLATVQKDGLFGVLNFEGKTIIPVQYQKIYIISK